MNFPKLYEHSGNTYYYISDLDSASVSYSPLEEKALESRGKDTTYPGEFCNQVVFGGVEISVDVILSVDSRSTIAQLLSPNEFQSATINLAKPLYTAFASATKLTHKMEFGQDEGEDSPARLEFDLPISGGVNFKWYKNGSVVATDSIINVGNNIAIAVRYSGNTVLSYAYVYTYNNEIWTSGIKNNSSVLEILNSGGFAGSSETKHGWSIDELGDFIVSKIFNHVGGDEYISEYAADGTSLTDVNNKLQENCDNFGGYLGTDLVSYMAGTESNAEGWSFLLSPEGDGTELILPTTDEHEYKIVFEHQMVSPPLTNSFVLYVDGVNQGYIRPSQRTAGSNIYLTWYKQSQSFDSSTKLLLVYHAINYQYQFYDLTSFFDSVEYQDFEPDDTNSIDGYDPNAGQEDENQDEPEDTEEPENDPLASGFLYAFMVGTSDMENLASCLKPDTLAQKIKADFGNNLYEFIVSYHMMPCLTNADSLHKVSIKYRGEPFLFGENNTQLQLAPITKTWYQVNCGTKVCLPKAAKRPEGFENWSQAKVQMYLPFIGYVHLNTADVWGEAITVVYEFDILQGTCVANIGVGAKGTIYSYSASCKYTIPFTSTIDMANQQLLSGIFSGLGAAVSVGGAVATGSPAAMLGAAGGVADSVGHFLSAAEHQSIINRGGNLSGAPGWLMPRKPALIVTIPDIDEQGSSYNSLNGLPCCIAEQLANYRGFYVEVGQIDLNAYNNNDGCSPNDTELDMIRSILKEGVYV